MNRSFDLSNKHLLLVDDDEIFRTVLGDALTRRGFVVSTAHNVEQAILSLREPYPQFAVVDLQMPGPSGLELVSSLAKLGAGIRIVVLTGYASISTAVEAVKLGAVHYLTKPADADDIVSAFDRGAGHVNTPISSQPFSVNRLQWEHIQKVLAECDGNISEAARQLGMHRRTLQRRLKKRPMRQ